MAGIVSQVTSGNTSPDFSLGRAFAIGAAKVASEQLLARVKYVGNATVRSGIIKGILAGSIYWATKNRAGFVKTTGGVLSSALTIDATEDVIAGLMKMWTGRSQASDSNDSTSIGYTSPSSSGTSGGLYL